MPCVRRCEIVLKLLKTKLLIFFKYHAILQYDSYYHIGVDFCLDNKKTYSTKPRECILSFFEKNALDSFSAKYFIDSGDFEIGEATVYRILARLVKEGMLRRIAADKGTGSVYQYDPTAQCGEHFHLKCVQCGETVCIDCSYMESMERHVEDKHRFSVDSKKTVLYGVCSDCKTFVEGFRL